MFRYPSFFISALLGFLGVLSFVLELFMLPISTVLFFVVFAPVFEFEVEVGVEVVISTLVLAIKL